MMLPDLTSHSSREQAEVTSLLKLQEAWENHPKFQNRALGGRRALDGFHYQLAVSLDRFFTAVLDNHADPANVAFEGLSDLAERRDKLIYLVQIKTALTKDSLSKAVAEALAIDEFLEDRFSKLRENVRFRIVTRRVRGKALVEPASLSAADLELDPVLALRWNTIRERCLPIEVDCAPEVRLAIRLWKDVMGPIAFIDRCVGRLLDVLSSGASPLETTKELLAVWESARRGKSAPLYLLGITDFETEQHGNQRIVHGVRPGISDLRNGCFMDRADKIAMALSITRERWATESAEQRLSVPIFWISGPSGAGKSVLLLQVLKELLANGELEAVNFIESYSHVLPRALDNASGSTTAIALAGDDPYSPENRDPQIWREVGEIGATQKFPSRFAIFTCGPSEQLRAFRRECERHRTFDLVEISTEPLNADEQVAYHSWYQRRTGTGVPLSKEAIFVAVAWIYELYREEKLTPESFAIRFNGRLEELGIGREGKAALALNLYGLKAPESLFKGHRAELAQLINERIWRLSNPSTGTLTGRFFHPQISRLIYEVLVPRTELIRRAEDIAFGFDSMLDESELADAFLGWLGSGKIGKARTRGALLLDEAMRIEILKAIWPSFASRFDREDSIPRLFRWHQAALTAEIDLRAIGVKSRIDSHWAGMGEDELAWSLFFQMVWDMGTLAERQSLFEKGRQWLEVHMDQGSWTWVYRRLLAFAPSDVAVRAYGLRWLERNLSAPFWPGVWGALYETRDNAQTDDQLRLVSLSIHAIPLQPEAPSGKWLELAVRSPAP